MINVENLTKKYKIVKKKSGILGSFKALFNNDYEEKVAVSDISFQIDDGEMVGYIGKNGAGKSTTIKMMTGILVPTSGKCVVDNNIPYKDRKKNTQNIGVVFGQRSQLWWDLPLCESFSLLKDIYGLSNDTYKERLEYLINLLDMKEFFNTPVRLLSLGQKMRGDLAAALIHNPSILFLDEPTIGLDIFVKEKIIHAVKEMNKKYGTTVILTTHDLRDVEELCSRIIVIDNGKKIYDGSLEKLKQDFGKERTIEIIISNDSEFDDNILNFPFELNASEEGICIEIHGKTATVAINSLTISVTDIISYFIKHYSVMDFSVKEMELDDIIKKIYDISGEVS